MPNLQHLSRIQSGPSEYLLVDLSRSTLARDIQDARSRNPRLPIVGVLSEAAGSIQEQVEAAYQSLLRHSLSACAIFGEPVYLITAERGIQDVANLEEALQAFMGKRLSPSEHFTKTIHAIGPVPAEAEDVVLACRRWAAWGLFEPYTTGDDREFGFVACRHADGMLITTRGSSKTRSDTAQVALVTGFTQPRMTSISAGRKPSRNANLAWHILQARPEVEWIVHTHMPLTGAPLASPVTAPGTVEDWEAVRPLVLAGHDVIRQPLHGSIILLKSAIDLDGVLLRHNLFSQPQGDLSYEQAYHRFQSSAFAEFVGQCLPDRQSKIIDAASGSGMLMRQLRHLGFQNLVGMEPSDAMRELNHEAPRILPFRLEEIGLCGPGFDAITIRQAINYIAPAALEGVFTQAALSLKPGGLMLFDTFVFPFERLPAPREFLSEGADYVLQTREFNVTEGSIIRHGQVTWKWPKPGRAGFVKHYDFNRFYGLSSYDVSHAASRAGFTLHRLERVGASLRYSWRREA